MTPPLLRSLWNQWRGHPPADTLARTHLKVDRGINEQSARAVLGIYKDNLAYANLKGDAKLPELSDATGGDSTTPPKVGIGDYVQWTSRGMDQFDSPRKVTWISEDFSHLRVHGSTTGIPMTEVVVAAAPKPKAERESLPGHASSSETSDREGKRDISVLLLPSGHLEITATVDAEGLKKLKQMLDKYTEILEMLQ